jgi:hypothetical protein
LAQIPEPGERLRPNRLTGTGTRLPLIVAPKRKLFVPRKKKLYNPAKDKSKTPKWTSTISFKPNEQAIPGLADRLLGREPPPRQPTHLFDPQGNPVVPGARVQVQNPLGTPVEWAGGFTVRGLTIERRGIQQRYPNATELPPNTPTFDAVEGGSTSQSLTFEGRNAIIEERVDGGMAISFKSADLTLESFKTARGTYGYLSKHVKDIVKYPSAEGPKKKLPSAPDPITGGLHRVRIVNPAVRVLHIVFNQVPNSEQMAGLALLQADCRAKGIELVLEAPQ